MADFVIENLGSILHLGFHGVIYKNRNTNMSPDYKSTQNYTKFGEFLSI